MASKGLISKDELSDPVNKKIDDADTNSKLAKQQIGTMSSLKTSKKDTLVNSINELFQYANNGKALIANVIGGSSSNTSTFEQLKNDIQTCKNILSNNLKDKNVESNNTDSLLSLVNAVEKVELINTNNIGIETSEPDVIFKGYQMYIRNPYYDTDKKVIAIILHAEGDAGNKGYWSSYVNATKLVENINEKDVYIKTFNSYMYGDNPAKYYPEYGPDTFAVLVYSK